MPIADRHSVGAEAASEFEMQLVGEYTRADRIAILTMAGKKEKSPIPPHVLLTRARGREPEMLDRLRALVEIESPSDDKAGVDQAVRLVSAWAGSLGAKVRVHRHAQFGDSLEVRFGPHSPREKPILLLGHLDTVWEIGTLARMPWKVTRERISGPGVLDMKAGVAMIFTALAILIEDGPLCRPVTVLLHGDEEIGSPASRPLTETTARRSSVVYVLEPAQGDAGAYKTSRKGVGQYRLAVEGVAAHSGIDFARGHSATMELAGQMQAIDRIADPAHGITINIGRISGGTRSNVVAAQAWAEIEVRIPRLRDQARVERLLRGLRPSDSGCALHLSGGWNRPPMERTASTVALFRRARRLAAELGIVLDEAATGGGSDGSFTSALGLPTLDGMGAVGAGAHNPQEHCLRRHLAPRAALLAAMLQ